MKFIKIRDEFNAIRAAGYTFDPAAERQIDRDLYQALCRERGERWTNGKLDALWDMDGSLYQGEDGHMYAVQEVFDDAGMVPLCWHRLCKEDKKMTYQIAMEKNESAEGLDLSELSLEDLLELINDVPGWDYPLGEESVRELAWRAGIDVGRYFAEPETCDRAGCWRENPDYSEDEPHGFDYNDLFADAAKALDVDF